MPHETHTMRPTKWVTYKFGKHIRVHELRNFEQVKQCTVIGKQSLIHLPLLQNLFTRFNKFSATRCKLRYLTYLQTDKTPSIPNDHYHTGGNSIFSFESTKNVKLLLQASIKQQIVHKQVEQAAVLQSSKCVTTAHEAQFSTAFNAKSTEERDNYERLEMLIDGRNFFPDREQRVGGRDEGSVITDRDLLHLPLDPLRIHPEQLRFLPVQAHNESNNAYSAIKTIAFGAKRAGESSRRRTLWRRSRVKERSSETYGCCAAEASGRRRLAIAAVSASSPLSGSIPSLSGFLGTSDDSRFEGCGTGLRSPMRALSSAPEVIRRDLASGEADPAVDWTGWGSSCHWRWIWSFLLLLALCDGTVWAWAWRSETSSRSWARVGDSRACPERRSRGLDLGLRPNMQAQLGLMILVQVVKLVFWARVYVREVTHWFLPRIRVDPCQVRAHRSVLPQPCRNLSKTDTLHRAERTSYSSAMGASLAKLFELVWVLF